MMGKLLGVPLGADACYTNHARADQNDCENLATLLAAAGCNYFMALADGRRRDALVSIDQLSRCGRAARGVESAARAGIRALVRGARNPARRKTHAGIRLLCREAGASCATAAASEVELQRSRGILKSNDDRAIRSRADSGAAGRRTRGRAIHHCLDAEVSRRSRARRRCRDDRGQCRLAAQKWPPRVPQRGRHARRISLPSGARPAAPRRVKSQHLRALKSASSKEGLIEAIGADFCRRWSLFGSGGSERRAVAARADETHCAEVSVS